jgi:hypothetical protein
MPGNKPHTAAIQPVLSIRRFHRSHDFDHVNGFGARVTHRGRRHHRASLSGEPNPVRRRTDGAPLNDIRSRFVYTGGAEGYTDYPVLS